MRRITEEEVEQLKPLYDLSKEIRGSFLDQAIIVESFIDEIISQHFCPEKTRRILYFSSVPPELTFHRKIKIFETILETCYPKLIERHSNLMKEIDEIRAFRNRIAHSILESSRNFLKEGYTDRIWLRYYKKGKMKRLVVKREDMKERLKGCTRVILALVDIQKEVIVSSEDSSKP